MDIDSLKQALARLDQRLDNEVPLDFVALVERARKGVGNSLLPLARRQIVQAIAGLLLILLGIVAWRSDLRHPGAMFASGLIVHAYGVLMIAFAVAARVHIGRIDEAGPLVEMQTHMARLRRLMLGSAYLLGLSWWLFWVPLAAVLLRVRTGVDLYEANRVHIWLWWTLAAGIVGYTGTWWFRRWARLNDRDWLAARKLDDILTVASVRNAQRWIDEVARFARD